MSPSWPTLAVSTVSMRLGVPTSRYCWLVSGYNISIKMQIKQNIKPAKMGCLKSQQGSHALGGQDSRDRKSTTKYNCKTKGRISSAALILTEFTDKHTHTHIHISNWAKTNKGNTWITMGTPESHGGHLDHKGDTWTTRGRSGKVFTALWENVGHTKYRQATGGVGDHPSPVFTWWYVGTLHFFLVLLWAA